MIEMSCIQNKQVWISKHETLMWKRSYVKTKPRQQGYTRVDGNPKCHNNLCLSLWINLKKKKFEGTHPRCRHIAGKGDPAMTRGGWTSTHWTILSMAL